MCRKAHSAGYVAWFGVPRGSLRIVAGEERLRTYHSSAHGLRRFCATCGTQLFCEIEHHKDVDVPLAAMEAPIDRVPESHFYYDSGIKWAQSPDELPRFGGKSGADPLDD